MAYHLPSERVEITAGDLTIEVARILAEPVYLIAVGKMAEAVKDGDLAAIRDLYDFFVGEAQPVWAISDHRGAVLPTVGGCLRLPTSLALRLIEGWIDDFTREEPASAADAVLPPGHVRDAVNAGLQAARKRKG